MCLVFISRVYPSPCWLVCFPAISDILLLTSWPIFMKQTSTHPPLRHNFLIWNNKLFMLYYVYSSAAKGSIEGVLSLTKARPPPNQRPGMKARLSGKLLISSHRIVSKFIEFDSNIRVQVTLNLVAMYLIYQTQAKPYLIIISYVCHVMTKQAISGHCTKVGGFSRKRYAI